jgi:tRNA dimethylallyltransferase
LANRIISIVGPTALGKTKIAIMLAKKIKGEIVSCDSMQVYRHMNVGTAKPSKEEMGNIPHFMIDIVDPNKNYSVALFAKQAKICIENIISRKKVPLLVGGAGLYFDAITKDIDFVECEADLKYREKLFKLAKTRGNNFVYSILENIDFCSFKNLHPNNLKRVVRALEFYHLTGKTITQQKSAQKTLIYDSLTFGLSVSREKLYLAIENRVDEMFRRGFVEEVKELLNMGVNKFNTSIQAIGYKEIMNYLEDGEDEKRLAETIMLIKQKSKNYAKRQLTWFRKNNDIRWITLQNCYDVKKVAEDIFLQIKNLF